MGASGLDLVFFHVDEHLVLGLILDHAGLGRRL
jgi:hypothetical protein